MALTNTWQDVGGTEEDSQIGQLLYYILGAVLYRVQTVIAPTGHSTPLGAIYG